MRRKKESLTLEKYTLSYRKTKTKLFNLSSNLFLPKIHELLYIENLHCNRFLYTIGSFIQAFTADFNVVWRLGGEGGA